MRKSALLLLVITLAVLVGASLGDIDSLKVDPASPTTEDDVRLELYCSYQDSCWKAQSPLPEIGEVIIDVTVRAEDGWHQGVICPEDPDGLVDFQFDHSLGSLPEGQYAVLAVEHLESLRDSVPDTVLVEFRVDSQTSAEACHSDPVSDGIVLEQNLPNPFNASTVVVYSTDRECRVRLAVYDLLGRTVKILVDGEVGPGSHSATWDGKIESGAAAPSGIYFYRLTAGGQNLTRKMILLK